MDTADVRGDDDGPTTFSRVYGYGEDVTLTAPLQHGPLTFERWIIDGAAQPAGQLAATVTLDHTPAEHTAVANYQ